MAKFTMKLVNSRSGAASEGADEYNLITVTIPQMQNEVKYRQQGLDMCEREPRGAASNVWARGPEARC